jgi:hypothetical protein
MAKPSIPKPSSIPELYEERHRQGPEALLGEAGTNGKSLARCAFDGTFQLAGPYEATDPDELRKAVRALLKFALNAYSAKFSGDIGPLLVETAKQAAHGAHTHAGKYIHASAATRYIQRPGAESSPYLTSRSAAGMRYFTAGFAHAPKHSTPARVYIATVLVAGALTTVAELLVSGNEVVTEEFLAAGVSATELASIQDIWRNVFSNSSTTLDPFLPQLLWPTESGDVAITGVPSLAVFNSISAMRKAVPEDSYLKSSSCLIGSGQAQNISVAASSLAGHFPVLTCLPPRVASTESRRLLRKAHTRRLYNGVRKDTLAKFDTDVHSWPNSPRHAFLERAARSHAAQVLSDAVALREQTLSGVLLDQDLPQDNTPLAAFARGESLTAEVLEGLTQLVIEQGPSRYFPRHAPADVSHYVSHVSKFISRLL